MCAREEADVLPKDTHTCMIKIIATLTCSKHKDSVDDVYKDISVTVDLTSPFLHDIGHTQYTRCYVTQ